jgi:polar amino acid transport system substrate-binding protein
MIKIRRKIILFLLILTSIYLVGCSCNSIKKTKSYRIGIDSSFYPLGLGLLESNTYGFVQELMLEMAEEMNVRFVLVKASWDNLFDGLDANKYRAVFSSMVPYNFNRDKYNFSEIFLETGPFLVIKKDSEYRSLDDFNNKLVGYIRGDDSIFTLEKYPDIIVKTYDVVPTLLDDVKKGYLDGCVVSSTEGRSFVKNIYANSLKMTTSLKEEGLRLVSDKENEEIIKLFNQTLDKLDKKGILKKIKEKWSLL